MLGKIILEEAFNVPRLAQDAVGFASPSSAVKLEKDMTNIRGRLEEMDMYGVEMQILSLTSPGCQGEGDPIEAHRLAVESNNWIHNEIKDLRHRFAAFCAVSMHDPEEASKELRRCVTDLGMVGVLLNDYQSVLQDAPAAKNAENGFVGEITKRLYYDHPVYDSFWATCQELGVPVYLHPRTHEGEFFQRRRHLAFSAHGFKTQLASHVLGIVTSGIFDRFPKLQLIFGHMGEGITNDLWRLDHKLDRARFPNMQMRKDRTVRDYFSTNLHITTSGHFSTSSLAQAIQEISAGHVMFSVDFPYEPSLREGCQWLDKVPISNPDKLAIGRNNAIKLLKLESRLDSNRDYFDLKIGGLEGNVYGHI